MAEAWAKEWIRVQRADLDDRSCTSGIDCDIGDCAGDDEKIRTFLDGLFIGSVALDDSAPHLAVQKPPKENAIVALKQDGIDISMWYAKSYRDILPSIITHRRQSRRRGGDEKIENHVIDMSALNHGGGFENGWTSFAANRRMHEPASDVAHAGITRDDGDNNANFANNTCTDGIVIMMDNLVVMCSCPDSVIKRRLYEASASTHEWDVDPPTAFAKDGEGNVAYVRVSHEIRDRVERFMDELKRRALTATTTHTN